METKQQIESLFLQMTIVNNKKTTIPQTENAKEYIRFVEERFCSAEKSLVCTLVAELTTMKYNRLRSNTAVDD